MSMLEIALSHFIKQMTVLKMIVPAINQVWRQQAEH
jgi:hypothetical protein